MKRPARSPLTARILSAAAVGNVQGRQLVVRLRASEQALARLRLTRKGATLVDRRGWVLPGANTLRVQIPASARKGDYDLVLTLADAARHRLTLHGGVLVPILTRRDPCFAATTCVQVEVFAASGPGQGYDDGNGEVTSSPAGIDCRFVDGQPDPLSVCRAYVRSLTRPSIQLALTLRPDPGSYVGECSQADALAGRGCTQTHTLTSCGNESCYTPNYAFDFLLRRYSLTLTRDGIGSGRVHGVGSRSLPSWRRTIDCRLRTCTLANVPYGATFALKAIPFAGSGLLRWSGACAVQRQSCSVTITQDTAAGATFGLRPKPEP